MDEYAISFNSWLKDKTGKTYLRISGIFAFAFSVISGLKLFKPDIIKTILSSFPNLNIDILFYIIQILFISFVVFFAAFKFIGIKDIENIDQKESDLWITLRLHKDQPDSPQTKEDKQRLWIKFKKAVDKTARQFVGFWMLCWIVWLIFYILLTINIFYPITNTSILNLSNNINALFFVFLFMTLSISTAKYTWFQWTKIGLIILIIFFTNLSLEHNRASSFSFVIFAGLFSGLSMSALIGSINSRTITIPVWALLLLNFYAAIQPLYIFFIIEGMLTEEYNIIISKAKIIILTIAFFLKIILFLLVTWILQTGRLIHFIIQEGALNFEKEEKLLLMLSSLELKEMKITEAD